jgi:hypothetical protein
LLNKLVSCVVAFCISRDKSHVFCHKSPWSFFAGFGSRAASNAPAAWQILREMIFFPALTQSSEPKFENSWHSANISKEKVRLRQQLKI